MRMAVRMGANDGSSAGRQQKSFHVGESGKNAAQPSTHASGEEQLGIRSTNDLNFIVQKGVHDQKGREPCEHKDPDEVPLRYLKESTDKEKDEHEHAQGEGETHKSCFEKQCNAHRGFRHFTEWLRAISMPAPLSKRTLRGGGPNRSIVNAHAGKF